MACNAEAPFLPSPRIQHAPTLHSVLTLSDRTKNTNWPAIAIPPGGAESVPAAIMDKPITDVQRSLLVGVANQRNHGQYIRRAAVQLMRQHIKTHRHALAFMRPDLNLDQ